jgi:hypothetical protein
VTVILVALIAAVSATTWTYVQLQHRSGAGNSGTAVTGASLVFVITFVVVLTVALTIFH